MKSISFILAVFIGLGVCNAFGKVEYLPMPQNQSVDEGIKSETEFFPKTRFLSAFNKLPLHFVANQGQLEPSVVYYAKSEGATVYCTEEGLVFGFAEGSISLKFNAIAAPSLSLRAKRSNLEAKQSLRIKPEARGELKGKVNYFIGNNPALWRTNIPTFSEVVYPEVYPGIDLVYGGHQRRLKYTFYLQPGADPNQIQMIYDGIEDVWVDDATGELVIQTPWGEMRDAAPVAYQEIEDVRKEVDVSFRLMGENRVGFTVGDYDPNFMLVLDPGYSTYLGGSSGDYGRGIAVDGSGNAYVTGRTYSTDFPTANAYDDSHNGSYDVFVTKLTASGTSLSYSTFLGGSSDDRGYAIAVDGSGNAYVTGYTSGGFPTANAYDDSHNGSYDVFVSKLIASGTLSYSTYLGGSSGDYGRGIAVDGSGNAYVTGRTESTGFPTANAYDDSHNGSSDAFVTKLNASGTSLSYSTFLGGTGGDAGWGIAVDGSENTYVAGYTSGGFPTHNAYDDSYNGNADVFVTKLTASGDALSYSTYLGGSNHDEGWAIAVDGSGNAYITGYTNSTDFPTANAYDNSHNGGWDVSVTKLTASGSALSYSTYLGGGANDYGGYSIAVDSSGNAYVMGHTLSTDFPTLNPYQSNNAGDADTFVASYLQDGSLPVELSLLTATASADGVIIRWRTETEVNNIGFRVYRSEEKDGNYTRIAFVSGAGNSAMPIDYQFTDKGVEAGKTYFYYLEDIDIAGEKSRFEIIKVVVPSAKPVETIPKEFRLLQNYPNPFNPETWLPYELAADATITIRIYNVNGQLVRQFSLGKQKAGRYVDKRKAAYWDGKDQTGKAVTSGLYFYTLKAGDFQATRRMVIVK